MLGRDQRHAGIDQFLLGVEHVERRALADPRFLAHAVKRDLGGIDLCLCVDSICALAASSWPQALHPVGASLIAIDVEARAAADRASPWTDG